MEDVGLDPPYDLARDGKWTIDRMREYGKTGASLNGDDSYLPFDEAGNCRYGYGTHSGLYDALIFGMGGRYVTVSGDDVVFNADSDKMYSIYDKIAALASTDGISLRLPSSGNFQCRDIFMAKRSMMCTETLGCVVNLRQMNDDYGILPVPKYDETQEEYISFVARWGTTLMVVPSTASDLERTGVILDALAYDSRQCLMEPYYKSYLTQKGARNEDSAEMLSIISRTRTIAPDLAYGWTSEIRAAVEPITTGDSALASKIASKKDKCIAKIEKGLEKYQ